MKKKTPNEIRKSERDIVCEEVKTQIGKDFEHKHCRCSDGYKLRNMKDPSCMSHDMCDIFRTIIEKIKKERRNKYHHIREEK